MRLRVGRHGRDGGHVRPAGPARARGRDPLRGRAFHNGHEARRLCRVQAVQVQDGHSGALPDLPAAGTVGRCTEGGTAGGAGPRPRAGRDDRTLSPAPHGVADRTMRGRLSRHLRPRGAERKRPRNLLHGPDSRKVEGDYLILPSLYSTCLRTTGSYFRTVIFSVIVRAFFLVT